ncbi:hypothetical protein [Streptomyces acidiscabies]|uniref:hypothetical protein n=1 Tax=Streptomyces acidiscabies TaxID=42234 RepID=UPI0038F73135
MSILQPVLPVSCNRRPETDSMGSTEYHWFLAKAVMCGMAAAPGVGRWAMGDGDIVRTGVAAPQYLFRLTAGGGETACSGRVLVGGE